MKIAGDITKLVGGTPMVRLNRVVGEDGASIIAKLEFYNPTSSIKDRIAVSMIDEAERQRKINSNTEIVEPTSGNTGIGLAFVCAARGYKLKIFIPENFSPERRKIMAALGAEFVLTPKEKGMAGAIEEAEIYVKDIPNTFMPMQFDNPANPDIHRYTTGPEIWLDTEGRVDVLVCGVGTGGTITGTGEFLKSKKPGLKVVAVEPDASPVLSGGEKGAHQIQGIGAGFVPKVLNTTIYDEVFRVRDEDAIEMLRKLAKEEGLFVGLSGAAAVYAAVEIGKRHENNGKMIVVIIPDSGDRYLSMDWFE